MNDRCLFITCAKCGKLIILYNNIKPLRKISFEGENFDLPGWSWTVNLDVSEKEHYFFTCPKCGIEYPISIDKKLRSDYILMNPEGEKIVKFETYCKDCKYANEKENTDPCNICLSYPTNLYSHKPVKFEERK